MGPNKQIDSPSEYGNRPINGNLTRLFSTVRLSLINIRLNNKLSIMGISELIWIGKEVGCHK